MRTNKNMNTKKPYPMPAEIIRTVSNAFDIKHNKKVLDDNAFNPHVPYQKIETWIEELAHELEKINSSLSIKVEVYLKASIKYHLLDTVVNGVNSNNDNREEILPFVALPFIHYLALFLTEIDMDISMLSDKKKKPVPGVITWIENNETNWNKIKFSKEDEDKIYKWKAGKHIPNKSSIQALAHNYKDENVDWDSIMQLLIVARAIGYLKRYMPVHKIQPTNRSQQQHKVIQIMREIDPIFHSPKTKECKLKSYKAIQKLESAISKLDNPDGFNYVIYSLKADRYVLNGNLPKAYKLYKQAFESCLYRGAEIEKIITKALVVAVHQEKIDKVFIRNLINVQITFGYKVPIHYKSIEGKLKVDDVIQDWQIEELKLEFHKIFPDEVLFKNVSYPQNQYRIGPLGYVMGNNEPDYKNPNKIMSIEPWNKKIPQLVWFTQTGSVNIVKQLLSKGAKVDVVSESNESAIGMAIEEANIFNATAPNQKLFDLISQVKHLPKTLNTRTEKKKLLPIISAVETGNPDIVKKVLAMGADPNILGSTDERSALYTCLQYIYLLKTDNSLKDVFTPVTSPEALDSYNRYKGGLSYPKNERYYEILNTLIECTSKNVQQYGLLDNFYQIAYLLLDNNANPNQEIVFPIRGHTPLMYATEMNEAKLVEKMIEKKGDINKTYIPLNNPLQQINCQKIAEYFKSKEVLEILKLE